MLIPVAFLLCGSGLLVPRLFTCLIVLADDPTTFFALKRRPSAQVMVRVGGEPIRRDYMLLDDDENGLVYEGAYLALMDHAVVVRHLHGHWACDPAVATLSRRASDWMGRQRVRHAARPEKER